MKRIIMVLTIWAGILSLAAGDTVWAGSADKLRSAYEKYLRSPIMASDMTYYQKSLLALELAMTQTGIRERLPMSTLASSQAVMVAPVPKSDTSFTWNTDHWVATDRTTNTYDVNSRLSTAVAETLHVATWFNSTKSTYTYTGSGKIASLTFQAWDSSAWANQFMETITYDGSGNPLTGLVQTWSGTAWVNYRQTIGTYSSGRLTSQQSNTWSGTAWVNESLTSYTYNGSGKVTLELVQHWSGSAWTNASQTMSTYTGGGDLAATVDQTWGSGVWTNTTKHSYVYNGSHQETVDTTSIWNVGSWYGYYVDSTKYSGALVTETVSASLLFPGGTRNQFTYGGLGNLLLELDEEYDLATSQYVNNAKTVYAYTSGGSCCVGMRGNVNGSGGIELVDLSALVSYLTGGGFVPPCMEAANVNGSGAVELVDLSALVSYLTGGGYVPPSCP